MTQIMRAPGPWADQTTLATLSTRENMTFVRVTSTGPYPPRPPRSTRQWLDPWPGSARRRGARK